MLMFRVRCSALFSQWVTPKCTHCILSTHIAFYLHTLTCCQLLMELQFHLHIVVKLLGKWSAWSTSTCLLGCAGHDELLSTQRDEGIAHRQATCWQLHWTTEFSCKHTEGACTCQFGCQAVPWCLNSACQQESCKAQYTYKKYVCSDSILAGMRAVTKACSGFQVGSHRIHINWTPLTMPSR